jgi:acetyltransferase-like isoleucine patch superfamily enzyme
MNKYSFCGYDCEIINSEIGSFCSIADNVTIGGAMHPVQWVSMSPVFYKGRDSVKKKYSEHERDLDKRTIIGHDVWIGKNALIKQGVHIGTGAVIGMGSVVTKNIPQYEIWAGNPAKFIRKRFDDSIINTLLEIKWWEWDENKLAKEAVCFNDIEIFIKNKRDEKA